MSGVLRVLTLAKSIGDLPTQATAFKNQGIVLKAQSTEVADEVVATELRKRSLAKYDEALKVHERIGDATECVKALRGLAGLHDEAGLFLEAEGYAKRSLSLAGQIGYRAGEARALRVLGEIATNQKAYPLAVERLKASLAIVESLGDRSGVARGQFGLAKVGMIAQGIWESRVVVAHAILAGTFGQERAVGCGCPRRVRHCSCSHTSTTMRATGHSFCWRRARKKRPGLQPCWHERLFAPWARTVSSTSWRLLWILWIPSTPRNQV